MKTSEDNTTPIHSCSLFLLVGDWVFFPSGEAQSIWHLFIIYPGQGTWQAQPALLI